MPEEAILYRVEDAAQLLGIGRSKFFELLATGQVPSVQIGRARRVSRRALEQYAARMESREPTQLGGPQQVEVAPSRLDQPQQVEVASARPRPSPPETDPSRQASIKRRDPGEGPGPPLTATGSKMGARSP